MSTATTRSSVLIPVLLVLVTRCRAQDVDDVRPPQTERKETESDGEHPAPDDDAVGVQRHFRSERTLRRVLQIPAEALDLIWYPLKIGLLRVSTFWTFRTDGRHATPEGSRTPSQSLRLSCDQLGVRRSRRFELAAASSVQPLFEGGRSPSSLNCFVRFLSALQAYST